MASVFCSFFKLISRIPERRRRSCGHRVFRGMSAANARILKAWRFEVYVSRDGFPGLADRSRGGALVPEAEV